ncbi:carboxylesterase/lipase family protein [Anaerocolumna xylanovorans]|uniref:Carboxylic ester hydrolase n=1 Tax=Anaerocolumna xylanovorans DSM 12503 TaxID=1121345 RepID=A0A1M7YIP7_9FIRM|nr:carboxylesterase family protein [Anaerocolumna xylanovorans]SHO52469.1 para-nitrobenzyl esterase [Anaerocolumna xylanovorans DSM 12503]
MYKKKSILCKITSIVILILFVFSFLDLNAVASAEDTGDSKLIRQTTAGTIEGTTDSNNTLVWRGIPYATPPAGDLRWKAPQEPTPWTGIKNTTSFGNSSVQCGTGNQIAGSEDCLYLNVWRPDTTETNLPVVVEIYGGANTYGSSSNPIYWGDNLAHKANAIVVTINYRLGILGWFANDALKTGDPLTDSGNFGLLDIIKALKWVNKNISNFGGDPGNVTVSGESAGGFNTLALLLSPEAKGLFHKAAVRSAIPQGIPMDLAKVASNNFIASLLVQDGLAADTTSAQLKMLGMSKQQISAYLMSKTPEELMKQYTSSPMMGMYIWPTNYSDGTVIVPEGHLAFALGTYPNKVPLMIGSTKDEVKLFLSMLGGLDKDPTVYGPVTKHVNLLWKAMGVDDIANNIASKWFYPPVYAYEFNWGTIEADGSSVLPGDKGYKYGAMHGLDIFFYMGNIDLIANAPVEDANPYSGLFTTENLPGAQALSNTIIDYFAKFIRTGDPGKGLSNTAVEWKRWCSFNGWDKAIIQDATLTNTNIKMVNTELKISDVVGNILSQPQKVIDIVKRLIDSLGGGLGGLLQQ